MKVKLDNMQRKLNLFTLLFETHRLGLTTKCGSYYYFGENSFLYHDGYIGKIYVKSTDAKNSVPLEDGFNFLSEELKEYFLFNMDIL